MRQFYLKLALATASTAGKDIQNHLRAIEDLQVCGLFEVSKLGRGQVVIENDKVCACGSGRGTDISNFTPTHKRGRVRSRGSLKGGAYNLGSRTPSQFRQLLQTVFRVRFMRQGRRDCPALGARTT